MPSEKLSKSVERRLYIQYSGIVPAEWLPRFYDVMNGLAHTLSVVDDEDADALLLRVDDLVDEFNR